MVEAKIMPEGFQPRRRGNRPVINITPMLQAMEEVGAGRWLAFELTQAEARSAKRQLEKLGEYDVSVEVTGPDEAVVYARRT